MSLPFVFDIQLVFLFCWSPAATALDVFAHHDCGLLEEILRIMGSVDSHIGQLEFFKLISVNGLRRLAEYNSAVQKSSDELQKMRRGVLVLHL